MISDFTPEEYSSLYSILSVNIQVISKHDPVSENVDSSELIARFIIGGIYNIDLLIKFFQKVNVAEINELTIEIVDIKKITKDLIQLYNNPIPYVELFINYGEVVTIEQLKYYSEFSYMDESEKQNIVEQLNVQVEGRTKGKITITYRISH